MRLVPETSALSPELRGQCMASLARCGAISKAAWLIAALICAGCQALTGGDAVATLDAGMTAAAIENASILAAATADRDMAVATIVAAGTRVAQLSAVNAALGATLRASYTATPERQVVIVSAEDMGSSLEGTMMDNAAASGDSSALQVSQVAMASRVDSGTGCARGATNSFSPGSERIYLTAQVRNLSAGTLFASSWQYAGSEIYRVSWTADRSRDFECVWFYATPADFDFAPGGYTAQLLVDGRQVGSAPFTIAGQ